MRCSRCDQSLPDDHHAVFGGVYFCFKCFLKEYMEMQAIQIPCERCGASSEYPHRSTVERLRSTPATVEDHHQEYSPTIPSAPVTNKRSSSPSIREQQHRPRYSSTPVERKTRTHACQVCYDEKTSDEFLSVPNHNCKQMTRSICDGCLGAHIQQAFTGVFSKDVRCPELDCGTALEYETIKHVLCTNGERVLFERYDKFICRTLLEQMDEFIWCSNPKCAMGQLNDGGREGNIVTCLRCRHKTCFIHKTPWHTDLTCDQYESTMDPKVQASLKWITQNTKQCPKCAYRIEKNDGCDHMTCIQCHYEFCWACLADFNQIRADGNHRHDANCKHYAAYDPK